MRALPASLLGGECLGQGACCQRPPAREECLRKIIAWTPKLPSTTCVTPRSTATDRSDIGASSVRTLRCHLEAPSLRNASRIAMLPPKYPGGIELTTSASLGATATTPKCGRTGIL